MANSETYLSNGELAVTIDRQASVSGLFYPYAGSVNHIAGRLNYSRIGVYCDGAIHWLNDGAWEISSKYYPGRLITHTVANNNWLNIRLEFQDFVDNELNVLSRNIHVYNLSNRRRTIKLFMHQAVLIDGMSALPDTVKYIPAGAMKSQNFPAIVHYKNDKSIVITGYNLESKTYFDDYSVGRYGGNDSDYRDGVWCDAADGILAKNNVECGNTDSIIGFELKLLPSDSTRICYCLAVDKDTPTALKQMQKFLNEGVDVRTKRVNEYWLEYINPAVKFASQHVTAEYRYQFIDQIISLRAHINNLGAPISTITVNANGRSLQIYGFSPLYAARVMAILRRLGYDDDVLRILDFIEDIVSGRGVIYSDYLPSGKIAPNLDSWIRQDESASPVQSFAMAELLYEFCQMASQKIHDKRDLAGWKKRWQKVAIPMADYLSDHIDVNTKLPEPAYSPLDGKYLTTTSQVAAVYGALSAAASLAELIGDTNGVIKYRTVADDIRDNSQLLWSDDGNYYLYGINKYGDVTMTDSRIDPSALTAVLKYGLFGDAINERAVKTIGLHYNTLRRTFDFSEFNHSISIATSRQLTVDLLAVIDNDKSRQVLDEILKQYYSESSENIESNSKTTFVDLILALVGDGAWVRS